MEEAFAFDFLAHNDGRLELILHFRGGEGRQEVAWRENFPSKKEAVAWAHAYGLVLGEETEAGSSALGLPT